MRITKLNKHVFEDQEERLQIQTALHHCSMDDGCQMIKKDIKTDAYQKNISSEENGNEHLIRRSLNFFKVTRQWVNIKGEKHSHLLQWLQGI